MTTDSDIKIKWGVKTLTIQNTLTGEDYTFWMHNELLPAYSEDPDLFKETLRESLGYENWVFAKISFNHWNHLKQKLDFRKIPDEKYMYNFYIDGIEGYLNAYETVVGRSLIINKETGCNDIHNTLIHMIEHSTMNFIHHGLWTALDGNFGGQDDIAAYYIAQTIMF